MCEKAEEIQKLWKYKMGDWFFQDTKVDILEQNFQDDYKGDEWKTRKVRIFGSGENKAIWLPTQEQLQGMVKGKIIHIWGTFNSLDMAVSSIDRNKRDSHKVCSKSKSMNELWLAFVMKEKYNKIWTGKDWQNSK